MAACECDEDTETKKVKVCGRHFKEDMMGKESKKLLKHAKPSPTIDLSRVIVLGREQCELDNVHETENNVVVVNDDLEMFDCSRAGPSSFTATIPALSENNDIFLANVPKLKKQLEEKRKENHNLNIKIKRWEEKSQSAREQSAGQYYTTAHFEVLCKQYLKPQMTEFVMAQVGYRNYTDELKQICLRIYLSSSNNHYDNLRKSFRLPSRSTLNKEMSDMCQDSGISDQILDGMKLKLVDLNNPLYKYCTIAIDEMQLQENVAYNIKKDRICGFSDFEEENRLENSFASHATVVLAQGLFEKWKQPIGYYLVKAACKGQNAQTIVQEAVGKLFGVGFIVIAVVSDQGSNFRKASSLLGASKEKPYFLMNGQKVWYLFDPPHLIKNTRNALLQNNIIIDTPTTRNDLIKWSHITELYGIDKAKERFRDAEKLSESHISPTDKEKMKVRFATQVFSSTVSRAINQYVENDIIEKSASATAIFLSNFDSLFDLCNSAAEHHPHKKFMSAYRGEQFQKEFFTKMLEYIKRIKILNRNNGTDRTNAFFF